MEGTDGGGGGGVDVLATGPLNAPMVTMVVRVGVEDRLGGYQLLDFAKLIRTEGFRRMGVSVRWIG